MDGFQTSLGYYVHTTMAPEYAFLAPKTAKPRKPSGPRCKVGSRVKAHLPGAPEGTVTDKGSRKGWWVITLDNGYTTECDRKAFTLI